MSITGGISFFDKSKSIFIDGVLGATAVASSNTTDQNLPLGTNNTFKWESNGSDDSTIETYTVTLAASISISRIFLVKHNFKNFQVQYGATLDFANVIGLDGYSDNKIDVTGFARNTAYFEFDAVTTDTFILTIDTTQVVDAEKFITQFIVTNEIGTLEGYPKLSNATIDRNIQDEEAISGRMHIQKGYESAGFPLQLGRYPVQGDIDILDGLHEREDSFLVWLSGGLPDQFRIKQRGFRVEDVYNMQVNKPLRNGYDKNSYLLGVNQAYNFVEVV